MEKLPHERLRDISNDPSADTCSICDYSGSERICNAITCSEAMRNTAANLADEIERYYIPRPRFEDGEPVQFGSVAQVRDDIGEVIKMVFNESGCEEVIIGFEYDSSSSHYMVTDGKFVKRHTPKVYDSDGVEIKVGDTVYNVNSGNGGEVKGFDPCELVEVYTSDGGHWKQSGNNLTHERPIFDAEGVRYVRGEKIWSLAGIEYIVEEVIDDDHIRTRFPDRYNAHATFTSRTLTHREPDSIQKVIGDMDNATNDAVYQTNCTVRNWASRLTALIERGA